MTGVPTIPGLVAAEQDIFAANLTQLRAKRSRNLLRAGLYDGRHAVRQIGSIVPPTYYQTAVVLGWPAKAVDLLARRCNLDAFTLPGSDLDSLGYRELTEGTGLLSELNQGFTSALLHSTAFVVTTRDESGAVTINARDALTATGIWNSRARLLTSGMTVSEWQDDRETPRDFTLYLDGVTVSCRKDGGSWSVDRSGHGYGLPIEHLPYKPRLGRPFGSSRISRPVISAYTQAVRTAIRMEGHADVFSFPQMILLGASSDVFRNADGSMKPAWQVALGRVFALDDDTEAEDKANQRAEVKRFESASPEPHLKMLKQQAELFAGETSIPITSLGVSTDGNPTSAESYIASREDLITEAEGATDDWTPALTRTMARALAMQNGERGVPQDFLSIAPKFRSPIYTSRAAAADAGAKQVQAVPWLAETEVGLELLGLDEQQIRRALAEKRRAEGRQLVTALRQVPRDDDAS